MAHTNRPEIRPKTRALGVQPRYGVPELLGPFILFYQNSADPMIFVPHVPSCPTIHLCSWSEPERAREEPPGRFMVMIPSVWGVWGLGSGGSRQSLSCCLSCTVLGFSREVEPSEYRLPRGLSGKESTCQCRSHRRTGV